jgi:hypothetical protein
MAQVCKSLRWLVPTAAAIIVAGAISLIFPRQRVCEPPYTLAIGSSVAQTARLLDSQRITHSTTRADELKSGLLTASGVDVPASASVGIVHTETKVVSRILGNEQTCVTIIWFDDKQTLLGLSRFLRRTWL